MSQGLELSGMSAEAVALPAPAKAINRVRLRRIGLMIVLGLTFLVYADSMRYEFTYDDRGQIMENEDLTAWRHAGHAFTKHVWWRSQHPDEKGTYYRPLFNLYFLANYQLFHLNPMGWHLLLIIWHMLATLLVYLLARRLLKDEVTALVAALLFGLHPVHIEAV